MGIDDISGKVSAFWVRAKSALSAPSADTPPPPPSAPRANGDSADLPHKGQYFAGYAFPEPANPPAGGSASPGAADAVVPDAAAPDTGAKVWAPLVIKPFESPEP
ncbi:hypothetical protein D3C87_761480 [compost metagenome]